MSTEQTPTELVFRCLERLRLHFPHWGETFVRGPGLYVAVVDPDVLPTYAQPLGTNRWPVAETPTVFDAEQLYRTATAVAYAMDGAVVVEPDGRIREQMVRFFDLDDERTADDAGPEYRPWMGTRHVSAVETSLRAGVCATLTLSEETGRVTMFRDGRIVSELPAAEAVPTHE
ncbi:DNA integrity scanning protein DisA nucleotide-binding domain protein [Halogeometricum limi]|uniref:DisA checkpoint controller nucleotide-binding n=1 Tax=Halogeometricum limi TaxID=555875 RepID=A0A1I6IKE1_9EURY|nr:diadenylate cyclase [Halogeometricum limi]SFR66780.1 DisA checkpoint controller nucleotide-binding [Halogeometricum limi]